MVHKSERKTVKGLETLKKELFEFSLATLNLFKIKTKKMPDGKEKVVYNAKHFGKAQKQRGEQIMSVIMDIFGKLNNLVKNYPVNIPDSPEKKENYDKKIQAVDYMIEKMYWIQGSMRQLLLEKSIDKNTVTNWINMSETIINDLRSWRFALKKKSEEINI